MKKMKMVKHHYLTHAIVEIEILMEYLIEYGADINEENENGETPLFNACHSGNKELVQYLIEHGTDIN